MRLIKLFVAVGLIIACGLVTFLRMSVYENDLTFWQDVAAKSPGRYRSNNEYGAALKKAGRLDEAAHFLERAIVLSPESPEALNNLATVYTKMGDQEAAFPLLQRALASNPDHIPALFNLAMYYYGKGMMNEAAIRFDRILSINPFCSQAVFSVQMLRIIGQRNAAVGSK